MNLAPGTRLGPYETIAHIGAGGMGDVYRARDTRLGRDVAIKTSKEAFDYRFQREARAIASLNHPNLRDEQTRSLHVMTDWRSRVKQP